ALDEIDRQKSAKEIEKANPFLNAQGLADKCKEEGAQLNTGEYQHLMDRCVAEGAKIDADTLKYLEGQHPREALDKNYIYSETTKGLIAIPAERLEQYRPHQLGQALDDIAEAYDGSKLQSGVRTVSDGIGTVFHEVGKAICMPTDVDPQTS
ncbi:MAG: hypothetical protein Q8R43_03420, partial [Alphaproteobacteria bacterium]|nr:hypothetical protein [Alphaproteobacteria bacterium]